MLRKERAAKCRVWCWPSGGVPGSVSGLSDTNLGQNLTTLVMNDDDINRQPWKD
jgi:hypothetical protein